MMSLSLHRRWPVDRPAKEDYRNRQWFPGIRVDTKSPTAVRARGFRVEDSSMAQEPGLIKISDMEYGCSLCADFRAIEHPERTPEEREVLAKLQFEDHVILRHGRGLETHRTD
jgi:hypothetical protein